MDDASGYRNVGKRLEFSYPALSLRQFYPQASRMVFIKRDITADRSRQRLDDDYGCDLVR